MLIVVPCNTQRDGRLFSLGGIVIMSPVSNIDHKEPSSLSKMNSFVLKVIMRKIKKKYDEKEQISV
jgi:hypothetical protein